MGMYMITIAILTTAAAGGSGRGGGNGGTIYEKLEWIKIILKSFIYWKSNHLIV
jgi:hypothetical protein